VNFYHRQDAQFREIEYAAARQGEDELNRWVADTLGRHPGLAGFYTVDERPADMVPLVDRQQRTLAAAAPGTVTYACWATAGRARRRSGATRWMSWASIHTRSSSRPGRTIWRWSASGPDWARMR
jgi:hypothetical protein